MCTADLVIFFILTNWGIYYLFLYLYLQFLRFSFLPFLTPTSVTKSDTIFACLVKWCVKPDDIYICIFCTIYCIYLIHTIPTYTNTLVGVLLWELWTPCGVAGAWRQCSDHMRLTLLTCDPLATSENEEVEVEASKIERWIEQ